MKINLLKSSPKPGFNPTIKSINVPPSQYSNIIYFFCSIGRSFLMINPSSEFIILVIYLVLAFFRFFKNVKNFSSL